MYNKAYMEAVVEAYLETVARAGQLRTYYSDYAISAGPSMSLRSGETLDKDLVWLLVHSKGNPRLGRIWGNFKEAVHAWDTEAAQAKDTLELVLPALRLTVELGRIHGA